jgi:hypothetical protein
VNAFLIDDDHGHVRDAELELESESELGSELGMVHHGQVRGSRRHRTMESFLRDMNVEDLCADPEFLYHPN